ncbi:MAG: antibiotic biosynthesis monooxygenase [Pseudomonadota bacterium]
MTNDIQPLHASSRDAATVGAIIQHHVRPAKREAHEAWLARIGEVASKRDGHVTTAVTRPRVEGIGTYSVILQFDDAAALDEWLNSKNRRKWIGKAGDLIEKKKVDRTSALEDVMLPSRPGAPPRWKTTMLIFCGICVLNAILALTGVAGWIAQLPWIVGHTLLSGIPVVSLAWVVMPFLTRWAAGWLNPT